MITPFEMYLLMQADAVCMLLGFAAFAMAVFAVVCIIGWFANMIGFDADEDCAVAFMRMFRTRAVPLLAITAALYAVTPNTKTIAAMIIVPKLTSPEVLQPVGKEAKELMDIAKDALRDLTKTKPKKAEESEE